MNKLAVYTNVRGLFKSWLNLPRINGPNELLNIVVSDGAIILAESLISLADIVSGPDAFLPFTQDINLKTSVNLICLNVK